MNFDITKAGLCRGATLIEASAGTGKTEAIAGIFLRLILEQNLSVEKILVVTFTEAATAELRDRIRKLLSEARAALGGVAGGTPYLAPLLDVCVTNKQKAGDLLDRALRDFDCASIFTIHGFCQRALKENAFESGMLFDTELITDEQQLVRETLQDFWRKNFYEQDAVLVNFALRNKSSPDDFHALVKKRLNYDSIRVITRPDVDRQKAGARLLETFNKAKQLWSRDKSEIAALVKNPGWAKGTHKKSEMVELNIAALTACLEKDQMSPGALECIRFFCAEELKANTAVRGPGTPKHSFFSLCDELCEREADYVCALELDCLHFVESELHRRKQRRNVQFFHDLLANLHRALNADADGRLAEGLRNKYEAALIDEFQDTDPLQYDIFRRVFRGDENFLFLIGDPKQAIYGFRGADIFTYLKAFRETPRRFTLPKNYRSQSDLVHAVNTVFQAGDAPFIFPEIEFHPVVAAGNADKEPLTFPGGSRAPLQFWLWNEALGSATKSNADRMLPDIVAAEISRLLRAGGAIGGDKLKPKHFAVLVLENQQAQRMQLALSALNIPSVLQTSGDLFSSREAQECERLLRAVAEPANERLVRAALATDLLGLNANDLETLLDDELAWHDWLEQFRGWRELWLNKGFIQMFRTVLLQENVRERLLRFPDGERRLTNVLHFSETLHEAAVENKLGIQSLLNWMADQMCGEGEATDENQLRLERDEEAVQLVTVHKSKGLQYPIVFCPFSWKPARSRKNTEDRAWFHLDGDIALDLCSPDIETHRTTELREAMAERIRLLYVAMTRAKNCCYVVWGNFNEAETSALAYLLHQAEADPENLLSGTIERFRTIENELFLADVRRLAAASRNESGLETIAITELPLADNVPYVSEETIEVPHLEKFHGEIQNNWRISSFSGLVQEQWGELPDFDVFLEPSKQQGEASGIFAFEHTTKAGRCIHKIFEGINLGGASVDHIEEVVRTNLQENGFSDEYESALCDMVRNTLSIELAAGLNLGQIAPANRLSELEFHFPLNEIAPATLQRLFAAHDLTIPEFPARLGKLTFNPIQGILTGFIDLVFRHEGKFFIVDWKSNWLGARLEDYAPEGIRADMLKHNYLLQYHLYTLALYKYLEMRLPGFDYERDFGGVFYIYVRGVDSAKPENGIFKDKPSYALIAELDRRLIGKADR